jgi:glutathione S-transferase
MIVRLGMEGAAMDVELLQFRFSPYNEKVRWALDVKRVAHHRRSLLPGPHVIATRKRTGQSATPVIRIGERWLSGSAAILRALDEKYPAPRLVPAEPALRARAEAIEQQFDEHFMPRMRRAALKTLLADPLAFARVFGDGRTVFAQRGYAAVLRFAADFIARSNGLDREGAIEDGERAIGEALNFVVTESATTGYLVGTGFSSADIAAAASLAVIVDPPDSPMTKPRPMTPTGEAMRMHWCDHPGAEWVRRIYREHRGAQRDFNGRSPYG